MDTIEYGNAQGYLWLSDAREPQLYMNQKVRLELDEKANPFVVEGLLYDSTAKRSLYVRFTDGRYIVSEYDWVNHHYVGDDEKADCQEGEVEKYVPNSRLKLDGKTVLAFRRIWMKCKDELNDGWDVLRPSGLVFAGFENK